MQRTVGAGLVVGLLAGCTRGSVEEYRNSDPRFTVSYPGDMKVGGVKREGDTANLSIANTDGTRELFLFWAKADSPFAPELRWSSYGHEDDHETTLSEGALPGGGKYIVNDRGLRHYIHALVAGEGWSVLCMASASEKQPDAALLDACKSLATY